jgi:hypothetical protein
MTTGARDNRKLGRGRVDRKTESTKNTNVIVCPGVVSGQKKAS